ncbi:MAG: type II secretion system F family protein, partial [Planctomycetota bacterium]|nr:type II secretion system F family protein [Planctomycetota bacterium]
MVLFAIVVIFLISLWLMVGRRSGFIPHRTAILADFISTLSDRGMPIAEGLDAWSADMPEDRFSMAVVEVTEDVRDGLSLSESFRSRPRYFSHRFAAAIQAGEETGTLPRLMNHFARHDDQAAKNARRALALFLYPMLVTVLMFGFLSIWIIKILPRIQAMYSSAEHELPQFTVWWSTSGGFYLLGFLVFVQFLFFFNAVKVFLPGRIRSDSFLASILGLYRGKEMRLRTVGVFLETLSELLDAEVPTGKAVELARGAAATGGRDIEMQNIQESVTEGEEISTAIIRGLDLNK